MALIDVFRTTQETWPPKEDDRPWIRELGRGVLSQINFHNTDYWEYVLSCLRLQKVCKSAELNYLSTYLFDSGRAIVGHPISRFIDANNNFLSFHQYEQGATTLLTGRLGPLRILFAPMKKFDGNKGLNHTELYHRLSDFFKDDGATIIPQELKPIYAAGRTTRMDLNYYLHHYFVYTREQKRFSGFPDLEVSFQNRFFNPLITDANGQLW